MPTRRELRDWARNELSGLTELLPPSNVELETLKIEIDALLCHTVGCSRTELITQPEKTVPAESELAFRSYIACRAKSEPIAYILKEKDFYKHTFYVNPAVLIPRPETELVVERALKRFDGSEESFLLCDICTGSGAIILSIADELKEKYGEAYLAKGKFVATDISPEALEVARKNAENLGLLKAIEFRCCDLVLGCEELFGESQEANSKLVYVANPPYIGEAENLPKDVDQYEPRIALRSGLDGLDVIKRLLCNLAPYLSQGAFLAMEIGEEQQPALTSFLSDQKMQHYQFLKDLSGKIRVLEILG